VILYSTTVALEVLLSILLIVRPGRKRYPLFQSLAFYTCAKDLALFSIHLSRDRATYFYAYYTLGIIEAVLAFCVVAEVARELFFPVTILPKVTVKKMLCTVIGVTTTTFGLGVVLPCRYPDILFSAAWTVERTLTSLECAMLWISILFAWRLGIPWRKRLGGIVAGLTFQTSVSVAALSNSPNPTVGRVIMISGMVTMIAWIYTYFLPEPALISVQYFLKLKKPCASLAHGYDFSSLSALTGKPYRDQYWAKKKQRVS
jgi:hypothetical protein